MQRLVRWILRLGLLAVVVAGFVYALWPRPVPVDIAEVTRGTFEVSITDDGEARVREVYVVSAPVTGQVMRFDGEVGDHVTAGESALTEILPTNPVFLDVRSRAESEALVAAAEAATSLAEAEVDRAQAAVNYAQAQYDRAEPLADRGTISPAELDRARLELSTEQAVLETARAALRVRSFELETARAALIGPEQDLDGQAEGCCITVRAPVSGEILRILQESEVVVPVGTPLVEIGDANDLEIVVDLLSSDAVRVSPGDPVVIEGWGGDMDLNGTVRRVAPFARTEVSSLGIEEQRVDVMIDITDPPAAWSRLGHGYQADIRIVLRRDSDVLQVPLGSLFREGGDWALFRIVDGVATLTPVEVGAINAVAAEIHGGLEQGETLVLYPSDRIADGVSVVPREGV
ncbi:MAG: HlyD family efflux transporter periplasmic adaptor subunit [Pseudomonadota bacterium]